MTRGIVFVCFTVNNNNNNNNTNNNNKNNNNNNTNNNNDDDGDDDDDGGDNMKCLKWIACNNISQRDKFFTTGPTNNINVLPRSYY